MERIRKALASVTEDAYKYFAAPGASFPYIVWGDDGANNLKANNGGGEKCATGYIDLYTKRDSDPLAGKIEAALEKIPAAFQLISVEYEEETGVIHHSWDWEL